MMKKDYFQLSLKLLSCFMSIIFLDQSFKTFYAFVIYIEYILLNFLLS